MCLLECLHGFLQPYMEKKPSLPGGHVFQPTRTIFKLGKDIIRINILIKLHEVRTINVAFRVLRRFCYSHIRKNEPTPGRHVLTDWNNFRTHPRYGQNKCSEGVSWRFNYKCDLRVLAWFYKSHIRKNDPPPGCPVFQPIGTILFLNS